MTEQHLEVRRSDSKGGKVIVAKRTAKPVVPESAPGALRLPIVSVS